MTATREAVATRATGGTGATEWPDERSEEPLDERSDERSDERLDKADHHFCWVGSEARVDRSIGRFRGQNTDQTPSSGRSSCGAAANVTAR
ncbi:hypothetical protein [Streptomyces sp. NRRL F-5135]|uniref:hypothetical protein n=1 Tax=Streptomyces sp. NRRL F-5135 TaxID=1463858 RepID=UPI0018FE7823|nr:hypothetical protein [Streptomyces sp. NRRL F-5135]